MTLFALLLLVRPGGDATVRVLDDVGLLAGSVGAGFACLVARRSLTGPTRRAWLLIGIGMLSWAAGQGYWAVAQLVFGHVSPFPTPADAAYLVSYAFAAAGIASFPSAMPLGRIRALLDGALVGASLLFVSWNLVLADALRKDSELMLAALYPVADVILAASLLWALARNRGRRVDLQLLALATGIHIATNTAYLLLLSTGTYRTGSFVDLGWAAWCAFTVAAAARAEEHVDGRIPAPVRPWHALAPYSAVALAVGTRIWMLATGRPTAGAAGALALAVVLIVVVRHVITLLENEGLARSLQAQLGRLEEAEAEAKNANHLLSAVLSELPGGAYRYGVSDPGRRLFVSDGFAELTGYATDELLGGRAKELIDDRDLDAVRATVQAAVTRGSRLVKARHRVKRKDGKVRWVDNRASISFDAEGSIILNGFLHDVTAEREAEQRAEHSRRVEAVGRLAAGVAHDVNNILTALQCHSGLLRRSIATGRPALDELDGVDDAARRVSALTRQLLSLSRPQAAQPVLVDVGHVAKSMEVLLRNVIDEHLTFTTKIEPGLPAVLADSSRLEQVVLNLVLNANDACRAADRGAEGRIELRVREVDVDPFEALVRGLGVGRHVLLEAIDNGMGMDAQTQEQCFDPFFTTKGRGGSGLGLATVFAVARECGGAVEVDSTLGAGTRFSVYLPRALTGGRVLVVDDDEPVRTAAERALVAAGYQVAVAPSSEAALERLARDESSFEVVLTDLRMPGMGGLELAEKLGSHYPDVQVLLMTGDASAAGGRPVLAKPFAADDVVAAVAAATTAGR